MTFEGKDYAFRERVSHSVQKCSMYIDHTKPIYVTSIIVHVNHVF